MLGLTPKSLRPTSEQAVWSLVGLTAFFFLFNLYAAAQSRTLFQGQVLDRAHSPIGGADVTLKAPTQTLQTKSDKNGHFEVVAPLAAYGLEVSARGFETRTIKAIRISASSRNVTVFLDVGSVSSFDPVVPAKNYRSGERLDGFVMDEFGAFISAASVTLTSAKKALQTSSDHNGVFAFKHVHSGRYTITVSASGFRAKTVEDIQITREDSTPLRIVLEANDHL
jgi:hypothetical protein